jgi:hypothetical protein
MSYLLVVIVFVLVYILQEVERELPLMDYIFLAVIFATIYVAGTNLKWLVVGIMLAIPTIILSFLSDVDAWPPDNITIVFIISLIGFIGFATIAVIREVLLAERVTIHTISGAIVAFLLLGLFWALLYLLAEGLEASSFSLNIDVNKAEYSSDLFSVLTYFSLITLTSTGYGDITPITDLTRSLAAMEAIVGQMFLAVLIAWLVGKFLSHSMGQNE